MSNALATDGVNASYRLPRRGAFERHSLYHRQRLPSVCFMQRILMIV